MSLLRVQPVDILSFSIDGKYTMFRTTYTLALASMLMLCTNVHATEVYQVLVAPKGSAAYDNAKALSDSNDNILSAERRIHRAFGEAFDQLAACDGCEVQVRIAAGIYAGKGRTGTWTFPEIKNPTATLKIMGGFDESFSTRQPFETPTFLQVSENRSQPVLSFEGKKHSLKSLVISGLVIDTGPSNAYDKKTNSLLKSGSSTWGLISLGYLETDALIISDNVFMNAPHGVASPRIRAMSDQSEVRFENNFFYNNLFTMSVESGGGKHTMAKYHLLGNSFVLNWPYNPDATTSNPGTVQIGNKHVAKQVVIERNLFAHNVGGAIYPQWDDTAGPDMVINENLFYKNGALFEPDTDGQGAIVGKFNRSAVHGIYDLEDIEDDFDWEFEDNLVEDPELHMEVLQLKALVYSELLRGIDDDKSESGEDAGISELDALNAELEELMKMSESGDIDDYAAPDAESSDMSFDDYLADSEVIDGDGDIQNYAPYIAFSPATLPIPLNGEAQDYGASPLRVVEQH